MMSHRTRRAALMLATLGTGIMAGLFLVYAQVIMPGLGATDDLTFVSAFQEIDRAVDRPWVSGTLICGVILTVATALLDRRRPVLWWVVAALLLQLTTMAVTGTVHLPLNDAIKAAGDPQTIDVGQVRADFREGWWRGWNIVRCVTSTSAFVCLLWSLVSYERADGPISRR